MPRTAKSKVSTNVATTSILHPHNSIDAAARKNRIRLLANAKRRLVKPYLDNLRFLIELYRVDFGGTAEAARAYAMHIAECTRHNLLHDEAVELGFTGHELRKRMNADLRSRQKSQGATSESIKLARTLAAPGEQLFFDAKDSSDILGLDAFDEKMEENL